MKEEPTNLAHSHWLTSLRLFSGAPQTRKVGEAADAARYIGADGRLNILLYIPATERACACIPTRTYTVKEEEQENVRWVEFGLGLFCFG